MKERVMVDSNGRKYITTEPELKNNFNPDWDAMAVMVEEQQRMAKRIEELTQRKEWVGLTDDEVDDIGCDFATLGGDIEGKNWFAFYLAIEAKLKEKNG